MSELPDPTAPEQVGVITIGTDEPLLNYAKEIVTELRAQGVRVAGDFGTDPMKAKIAEAENCASTRCWSSAVVTWKPAR